MEPNTVKVEWDEGKIDAVIESIGLHLTDAAAEAAYDLSQDAVPVLTGALKRSGRVVRAKQNRDARGRFASGFEAKVVYGGGEVDYAAIVHELGSPAGRGQHFLRNALMSRGVKEAMIEGAREGARKEGAGI